MKAAIYLDTKLFRGPFTSEVHAYLWLEGYLLGSNFPKLPFKIFRSDKKFPLILPPNSEITLK